MPVRSAVFVVLLASVMAMPASAQSSAAPERANAISFSPILALFEILQAEYERKVGAETTAGLGVGYWSFGDADLNDEVSYLALDLKGRFYPDRALEGFAIGGTVGVARIGYENDTTGEDESTTGFAFGVEVSHAWLLGDEHRWFLAAGLGAKRYIFGDIDEDIPVILPTGRIGFGLAF